MQQLVEALQECHRRKDGAHVLHRDLKPANVFLDGNNNVKLGDFGLARVLQHDTSFAKTFVGTPYYMSPVSCMFRHLYTGGNKICFSEEIHITLPRAGGFLSCELH